MHREELVRLIAKQGNWTKKEVAEKLKDIDFMVEVASKNLDIEDKVKLGKYLAIEKVEKKERDYTNPRTKEKKRLSAKTVVKVKGSPVLKNI